jgi:hypothetical protein
MSNHMKARKDHENGPRGGRPFTGIRLLAETISWLDEFADEQGTSRAGVLRAAVVMAKNDPQTLAEHIGVEA